MAETLKLNGYSTAQFGKCHEVPVWETSPMGPFDHWPHPGGGFEYFYGFIGGETNQWYPALYEFNKPVEPDRTPEEGYHFTEDLTDKAITWIRSQKSLMGDKPFFAYFAPGATHAPHHVAAAVVGQVQGARSIRGGIWCARRRSPARRSSGVIPADAELTARPAEIPAWNDVPDDLKPVLSRQMEIYAGFLEHTDHEIGRLIEALGELGGPRRHADLLHHRRQRGQRRGWHPWLLQRTRSRSNGAGFLETTEFMVSRIDDFGTPKAYNHYAVGWAHAMCTPYQWTKQIASHWGGTRNGTIVHWPNGIASRGELRHQFTHVIDIAPTVLEAAGLPEPTFVNGVQQMPLRGGLACATRSTTATRRTATRRSTSRCSATVGSTTTAGRP